MIKMRLVDHSWVQKQHYEVSFKSADQVFLTLYLITGIKKGLKRDFDFVCKINILLKVRYFPVVLKKPVVVVFSIARWGKFCLGRENSGNLEFDHGQKPKSLELCSYVKGKDYNVWYLVDCVTYLTACYTDNCCFLGSNSTLKSLLFIEH